MQLETGAHISAPITPIRRFSVMVGQGHFGLVQQPAAQAVLPAWEPALIVARDARAATETLLEAAATVREVLREGRGPALDSPACRRVRQLSSPAKSFRRRSSRPSLTAQLS